MNKTMSSFFLCALIVVGVFSIPLFAMGESSQEKTSQSSEQNNLKSLNKIISVNLENVSLEKALSIIVQKTKVKLNYNRSHIPVQKKVSVKMENVPAIEALMKVLDETVTELTITNGGQIAVTPRKTKKYDQQISQKGTIKGQVLYSETQEPLAGVNVMIENSQIGVVTDKKGNFLFQNIHVGNYTVVFSLPGFEKLSKTDVIVRSKRITFILAKLKMAQIEADEVVVTARFFSQTEKQPTSTMSFSMEEVRRAPSLFSDLSRTISGLPSVAKVNHQWNGMVVRGGSPIENGFFIDNIEVPNINHFPVQGSSAGLLSLLNVDLIENVSFSAGGFSTIYGNKLSSITDLSIRSGNRDELDFQLDLNTAGVGGTVEGPIGKEKGSWLFSARRSFIEFINNVTNGGDSDLPKYSDFCAKLVFDLSPKHRISFLNILGKDDLSWNRKAAIEDGDNFYGGAKITQNIAGMNWRYLWGDKGYSDTSISHVFVRNRWDFSLTATGENFFDKNSHEYEFRVRNINHFRKNPFHKLEFGIEVKLLKSKYDDTFGEYNDLFGNLTPEMLVKNKFSSQKYAAFFNHIWTPWKKLTLTMGIHIGHFAYNKNTNFSPRFSFSYKMSEKTSFNGATGIYHQNIPMVLLSQKEDFKDLKNPRAFHYVLGIRHLFSDDTRMTIEVFHKEYDHFPLDPKQPTLFIIDEAVYRYFFYNHEYLVDNGKARSSGIEFMIQKKLTQKIYGLLGGSLFKSRYRDLDGVWRNRAYDNRYNATIEAGYKPNHKWEFSIRWMIAGGIPYTPLDIAASKAIRRAVFDTKNTNTQRYPAFNRLNIRFDRRFHFSGSTLICYFSIWNVLNNKGVDMYEWNETYNYLAESEGFPRIPVFGLEFEF